MFGNWEGREIKSPTYPSRNQIRWHLKETPAVYSDLLRKKQAQPLAWFVSPSLPLKIKGKKWTISLFFEPQQLMRLNDKTGSKERKMGRCGPKLRSLCHRTIMPDRITQPEKTTMTPKLDDKPGQDISRVYLKKGALKHSIVIIYGKVKCLNKSGREW